MRTFEHEPVPGLPEKLPEGERILWQGSPGFAHLTRHTFRVHVLGVYFTFFVVLRGLLSMRDGASVGEAVLSAALVAPLGLLAVGLLMLMAWAHARTTIYTLTNRRIVIRYGIAIRMAVNLPFRAVLSAEFTARPDGGGDIPIKLGGGMGPGYAHLWPHVRPWRFSRPEPMIRGIDDVQTVAKTFAEALISFREGEVGNESRIEIVAQPSSTSVKPTDQGLRAPSSVAGAFAGASK